MKINFYSERRLLLRGGPETAYQSGVESLSGMKSVVDNLYALIDYVNVQYNNPSRTRVVQSILKGLGYNLGTTGQGKDGIDGDYGPVTRAAVRALQNDLKKIFPSADISVDGIFGPQTATYANQYVSWSQRQGLAKKVRAASHRLGTPVPLVHQFGIPERSQHSLPENMGLTPKGVKIESDASTERQPTPPEAREQRERVVLDLSVIQKTNGKEIVDFIVKLAKRGHPHFKIQNNRAVLYFSQNKRMEFYGVPLHNNRAFLRIGNSIYFSQKAPNPYQFMHTGRNNVITKFFGMPERRYGKLGKKGTWIIPNVNNVMGYPVRVEENGDGTYRVAGGGMDFDRSGFVITRRERRRRRRQERRIARRKNTTTRKPSRFL